MSNKIEKVFQKVEKNLEEYANTLEGGLNPDTIRFGKLLKHASDVSDFGDFNTSFNMPNSGEYSFKVEQKYLKEAVKLLNLSSHTSSNYIEVQVFDNRLKLSVLNQTIFSEVIIPLVENSVVDNLTTETFCFYIGRDVLNKIALRFKENQIDFVFKSEVGLIVVISGNTILELGVPIDSCRIDYHKKLRDLRYVSKVDTNILRDAVKYISYFVKKDNVKKYLSQADLKNSMLYGGSFSAVGIYNSKVFKGLNCNIKYEGLAILGKVLPYFNEQNTHLFEAENYYVLRDENFYFGFEKSTYSFPPVDKFIGANLTKEKILVSRQKLLESLNKLSIVLSGSNSLIKLEIYTLKDSDILKLVIRDISGKTSVDSFEVDRELEIDYSSLVFIIDFNTFLDVISHFDSDKIGFQYIKDKVLVIKDEYENCKIISNFSLFSENSFNQI